jgi:hypothetical protein
MNKIFGGCPSTARLILPHEIKTAQTIQAKQTRRPPRISPFIEIPFNNVAPILTARAAIPPGPLWHIRVPFHEVRVQL